MPRSNDTVKELHPVNEIVIPDEYNGKKDNITWHKEIVEIAERYNIIPKKPAKGYKPSSESYIQAIHEWAEEKGYRIVRKNTVVT